MKNRMYKYTLAEFSGRSIYILRKSVWRDYLTHWHDVCELEFILSGSGRQILNGREYPLHGGCMYMLTPADCVCFSGTCPSYQPESPLISDSSCSPALPE